MTDKLLDCPFCGGEAEIRTNFLHHFAICICKECNTVSDYMNSKAEAIAAWNRRTPPAAVPDGWLEAMKLAEKALHPFYAAVFNDNGDMTVSGGYPYHEAIAGYHAYKRVRDAISAAPAAPNGWQPIETAPRDGTDVLLWDGEEIFVGYWSDSIWVSPGAWVKEEHRSDTVTYIPTHWMPIPAAPTEASDE